LVERSKGGTISPEEHHDHGEGAGTSTQPACRVSRANRTAGSLLNAPRSVVNTASSTRRTSTGAESWNVTSSLPPLLQDLLDFVYNPMPSGGAIHSIRQQLIVLGVVVTHGVSYNKS